MARKVHKQVVTANDLLSGDVVYFTAKGGWDGNLASAKVVGDPNEAQALLDEASKQQDVIVGAYLTDMDLDGQGLPVPVHFREVFRTRGPSNYFHGKQAEV